MRRAMEWRLYMLTHDPDPLQFLTPHAWQKHQPPQATPPAQPLHPQAIQQPTLDATTYEPGISIRQGWAGRTQ